MTCREVKTRNFNSPTTNVFVVDRADKKNRTWAGTRGQFPACLTFSDESCHSRSEVLTDLKIRTPKG